MVFGTKGSIAAPGDRNGRPARLTLDDGTDIADERILEYAPSYRLSPVAAALFGGGLAAFALSRSVWLSLPLLAVAGFGMMLQMSASNTVLQTVVDDAMRGRLMSFYTMAFMGTAPFGSLLAGVGAERLGAPGTLILGGVCCLAGAAFFATRLDLVRRELRAADAAGAPVVTHLTPRRAA
jgi:MFS family permease